MKQNSRVLDRAEEREFVRRDILDAFQIYLMMPFLGSQKVSIFDVSVKGLSFRAEPGMKINEGMQLDCYLYLNSNIRIPLNICIVHRVEEGGITKAGCKIRNTHSSTYTAYVKFVELLQSLAIIRDI